MITTVKLKKYVANAYILGIIVSKLCYKKKPSPVILFLINKDLKIGTILLLSLAISLWVESDKKLLFNSQEVI